MDRLLIVTADDYGLTPGVCRGVLRGHRSGVVTTTSVLANGPALGRWVRSAADSGIGAGAHLCMVGEDPPVLSPREVPTLVGRSGRFPGSWRHALARIGAGRVDPADVRREFDAQIALLRESGLSLTHLDTHQHLQLWPAVGRVVISLAVERGIGAVRVPRVHRRSPRARAIAHLAARFARAAATAGLAHPDDAAGLDGAGRMDQHLVPTLEDLARRHRASVELITHPGAGPDPDRSRYAWGYRWEEELEALCSEPVRASVQRLGFRLGTFGDLAS